ncbi:Uncharacterized protein SCF082_LOCUS40629 [Durusdinium trenchii]|uniref:DUF2421 domain-containing protein n=2 Tax=Durusdinium trenchii TaxID=1381693 RepID=A0ABP0QC38_9DINO
MEIRALETESPERELLIASEQKGGCGCCTSFRHYVQALFMHRRNPGFARNAELSFRGAFFLLICAIPVIIPDDVSELRDKIIEFGIYNSSVCVFIVFNMRRTFGEAFQAAISGIKGTALAALMGWLLYTICPRGYLEGNSIDFWLGTSIGTSYVCAVMFLDLNLTMQMFAISNFASTWMDFLNPNVEAVITPPWAGNWSIETDTLLQGLICTTFGFLTVMIASILPYPMWSLKRVQENQLVMNHNIANVLREMVKYYCKDDPNVYEKDAVLRQLRELHSMTDDNEPLIVAAWWECFGLGRTQRKRQVLNVMDKTTMRVYDLAFNAWTVSTASDAEGLNAQLMFQVKGYIFLLLQQMEELLDILVKSMEDGDLSLEEQKEVQSLVDKLQDQEKELANVFYHQRRVVTLNKAEFQYRAVRVAQVLVWTISRIVGEIVQVANRVCEFSQDQSKLPPPPESGGWFSIFSINKDHLLYAWRGITSYFLCFVIGYFGFGEFIKPRQSAIAATAPLLLSMYRGSALVNDLNRIQGLMLGNVLARLLRGFVDSCAVEDLVLHSAITFIWTFGGLFVSFNSRTFSTVGLLAAAFGASTLLQVPCSRHNVIHKRDTFDGLMMNCVAVLITMIADSLFHSDRASDLAFRKLDQCWQEIFISYKSLLDPKTTEVVFRCSTARKLLREAQFMGGEAALEPRFWRIPWQHNLFNQVCLFTDYLVIALAAVESAAAEHGRSQDPKFPTFVKLSETASNRQTFCMFGDEKSVILLLKFAAVKNLLKIFIHETVQPFEGFTDKDSTHQYFSEQKAVEEEFIRETVPLFFGLEDDEPELSMSNDEMAHLSVVFAGFHRTTQLLRSVQHTILSSHWEA